MKTIVLLTLLTVSNAVLAVGQAGITPTMVGVEGNGVSDYIGISPNPNNCLYSGVYFNSGDLKAVLSVALTAKTAGKTLHIDYSQAQPGAQCIGSNIYVE